MSVDPVFRSALFVTHPTHIGSGGGGVQKCTSEYMEELRLAGFALDVHRIVEDRRFSTRLVRQALTNPYIRAISPADRVRIAQRAKSVDVVFVNQMFLAGAVAEALSKFSEHPPIVALSHGCEITDFLHLVRLRQEFSLSGRVRPFASMALGSILAAEAKARSNIDAVITISPSDAEQERWYGVERVIDIPRAISPAPINWVPAAGRFGYVGTLDHGPNLEGVVRVLEALAARRAKNVAVHIVGGPERLGRWLSERFEHAHYLGRLSESQLLSEASSWMGFIHPIFCRARGASTKLADALEWGVPVLTTTTGRRGYEWRQGKLLELDGPEEFASTMTKFSEADARAIRHDLLAAAESSPSMKDISERIAKFLEPILVGAASKSIFSRKEIHL